MTERMIRAGDVDICTQAFGDPAGMPLLLIMGASAQMLYWTDEFIQPLVQKGRYIIRYDNRDVGRSTCFDFMENPYTLDDMAQDALGVMDAYGLARAHIAGASMGGMIAQLLAIHHPDRLTSATLIMSTPVSGGGGNRPELSAADLPGPDPAWMEKAMATMLAPAQTREEKIARRIDMFAMLAGSIEPLDRAKQRLIAAPEVDRAVNFDAMNNHGMAVAASHPSDRRPLLKAVDLPVLVVHGTEDPILPYPHGVALADAIPGAELFTMEGAGHDMPSVYLHELLAGMIALQDRAEAALAT